MHLDLGASPRPYAGDMGDAPHLLVKIDTKQPIELGEFVSLFAAVGSQFDKFIADEHPEERGEARFYVKEVRHGCIEAELIGWVVGGPLVASGAIVAVQHLNTLGEFVERYGGTLLKLFKPGGRVTTASKGDLSDFHKTVAAIAHDPDASMSLSAAVYEDGERQVRVAFKFGTQEAREAERQIAAQRQEMETTSSADHERVLMTFVKTDKRSAKPGKRTGELVVIEALSPKALPIVYASALAEQRIKHEIADGAENIYKRAFDVDVNVEMHGERQIAYRVVAVHDVIDLPDED